MALHFSVTSKVPDFEPFVDATRAAEFLAVTPRYLLGLARRGDIPAHPLGSCPRKVWRFRLSELSDVLAPSLGHNSNGGSSALNGERNG
jgi:hypothetical protein